METVDGFLKEEANVTAVVRGLYHFLSYLQAPDPADPDAAVVMKMLRRTDGRLHAVKLLLSRDFCHAEVDTPTTLMMSSSYLPSHCSTSSTDSTGRSAFGGAVEQAQPGVVPVRLLVQNHDVTCLVMPYATGGDLFHCVVRRQQRQRQDEEEEEEERGHQGGLAERRVVGLMIPLVETLCPLHARHIAHMDIKMENVLLDHDYSRLMPHWPASYRSLLLAEGPTEADIVACEHAAAERAAAVAAVATIGGGGGKPRAQGAHGDADDDMPTAIARLTDFELATNLGPRGMVLSCLTGTNGYVAPEIALANYDGGGGGDDDEEEDDDDDNDGDGYNRHHGRRPRVTTKCDIWSVGHLMYQTLTGKSICRYSTTCRATTCRRQLRAMELGSRWLQEIESAALRRVVANCMQPRPEQRPTTVQLLRQLRAVATSWQVQT